MDHRPLPPLCAVSPGDTLCVHVPAYGRPIAGFVFTPAQASQVERITVKLGTHVLLQYVGGFDQDTGQRYTGGDSLNIHNALFRVPKIPNALTIRLDIFPGEAVQLVPGEVLTIELQWSRDADPAELRKLRGFVDLR